MINPLTGRSETIGDGGDVIADSALNADAFCPALARDTTSTSHDTPHLQRLTASILRHTAGQRGADITVSAIPSTCTPNSCSSSKPQLPSKPAHSKTTHRLTLRPKRLQGTSTATLFFSLYPHHLLTLTSSASEPPFESSLSFSLTVSVHVRQKSTTTAPLTS